MRISTLPAFVFAAAAGVTSLPASAIAVQTADEFAVLRSEIEQLKAREAEALSKVEALERRLNALEASRISDLQAASIMGRGLQGTPSSNSSTEPGLAANTESDDRKSPAPTAAAEDVARQQHRSFSDRFAVEIGTTYSHFDSARINLNGFLALDAIFLGKISIDQLRADILTFDATARYGLNDRLQFDVNVPYLYRHSNFQSGGAGGAATSLTEENVTGHGLGDINFGVSYRLIRETPNRPDIVLNARVKAPTGRHPYGVELVEVEGSEGNLFVPARLPTGSGLWGASIGISALKTIDPLVVFGSATFFKQFARSFSDVDEAEGKQPGRVRLGDAFQWGAGVAYALNDYSSLSTSFTQRWIRRSKVRLDGEDYETIVGSQGNVGIVNLGGTFSLNRFVSLVATVGIGVTEDAPDLSLGLRVPIRF
ncbi:transporter [Sphingomonas xanthus]|uniref:Transporter n=1 Tax=Sphingomonas xanthus TaxID=2594473 RepID=A0A516INL1_9SPHN|nr:transporter [Sphingomonas xanthus]QDP18500.1 transporter [Sphingomonas xanthus]